MACCLPTCAQGSSVSVTGFVENCGFCAFCFWLLLGALCLWEVLAWQVYPLMCTGLGSRRCAYCWTRPVGGGRWEHYNCDPQGVCWAAQKNCQLSIWREYRFRERNAENASLGETAQPLWLWCMWGNKEHSGEIAGKLYVRLLFLQMVVFLLKSDFWYKVVGLVFWHLLFGRQGILGLSPTILLLRFST